MAVAARRWIAISPDDRIGYTSLAKALAASGAPWESVDEAVAQAAARQKLASREIVALPLLQRSMVAALHGDFASADQLIAAYPEGRFTGSYLDIQFAFQRIRLAVERGDLPSAARLAAERLQRRHAFATPELGADLVPFYLAIERRAGTITRAELRTAMDEWRRQRRSQPQYNQAEMWLVGDAKVVETREDAEAAIAIRPPLDSMPPGINARAIALVSMLAGRLDEAARFLADAVNNCELFDDPIGRTQSALYLGQVREQQGDTAAACAAYAKVLARWGKATPRSVTAETARRASERLRCGTHQQPSNAEVER
jgi:serine/threonine-protein kinase